MLELELSIITSDGETTNGWGCVSEGAEEAEQGCQEAEKGRLLQPQATPLDWLAQQLQHEILELSRKQGEKTYKGSAVSATIE